MKTLEIGVMTPQADRARALALARQVDSGADLPEAVSQLNVTSMKQLFSAITEKRLELIRHVANQEGLNIRQLAHRPSGATTKTSTKTYASSASMGCWRKMTAAPCARPMTSS